MLFGILYCCDGVILHGEWKIMLHYSYQYYYATAANAASNLLYSSIDIDSWLLRNIFLWNNIEELYL